MKKTNANAAICARVSTTGQTATSPSTRLELCKRAVAVRSLGVVNFEQTKEIQ